MNRLNVERRTQAIGCLVEGSSIRSVERMTGIHRDTMDTVSTMGTRTGECVKIGAEKNSSEFA